MFVQLVKSHVFLVERIVPSHGYMRVVRRTNDLGQQPFCARSAALTSHSGEEGDGTRERRTIRLSLLDFSPVD